MITCKNCKYWFPNDSYASLIGSCFHEKFIDGYVINPKNIESDAIYLENDEGWACFTGPDFGCIHAEESGNKAGVKE